MTGTTSSISARLERLPMIAAVFSQVGYAAVFAFIAGCYVVRGLVYLLGPATTGRSIEVVSPSLAVASVGTKVEVG
jgi:hypothetical protein